MVQIEYDMYLAPDTPLDSDGTILDWSNVYKFDDRDRLFLYSFSGWGMPGIEYITQQGPFEHGSTVLDYRLQPRVIQLVHRRLGYCRNDYWSNRGLLIDALRPNRQLANSFSPGRLRKILSNGDVRDIEVFIEQGPIFNPREISNWDEYAFQENLRFIAHNPIIFDPAVQSAVWVLSSLENLIFYEAVNWENRLVFEGDDLDAGGIWFGESSIGDTLDVNYTGTWLSYPTIYITGPVSSPQIYNNTTNEKVALDYDVAVGETVTINLEYGNKTVINNANTNLIGTVTTDSDLATFHIAPDPEAVNGINQLLVTGDDAVIGQTEIRIEWHTNYIGI